MRIEDFKKLKVGDFVRLTKNPASSAKWIDTHAVGDFDSIKYLGGSTVKVCSPCYMVAVDGKEIPLITASTTEGPIKWIPIPPQLVSRKIKDGSLHLDVSFKIKDRKRRVDCASSSPRLGVNRRAAAICCDEDDFDWRFGALISLAKVLGLPHICYSDGKLLVGNEQVASRVKEATEFDNYELLKYLSEPVMNFIKDFYSPHTKVIIDQNTVELLSGEIGIIRDGD